MVVTTHQPIFLPWPGLFYKALQADALVLLDRVQFPQGRGWLHRNRLKSDQGDHWLRVPIRKGGRGGMKSSRGTLSSAALIRSDVTSPRASSAATFS
jgi:hypothetical protein